MLLEGHGRVVLLCFSKVEQGVAYDQSYRPTSVIPESF